jgi:hypothetical protein
MNALLIVLIGYTVLLGPLLHTAFEQWQGNIYRYKGKVTDLSKREATLSTIYYWGIIINVIAALVLSIYAVIWINNLYEWYGVVCYLPILGVLWWAAFYSVFD